LIYLLLSIACSSLIFLIFRSFKQFKVQRFPAIVLNYLVAAAFGYGLNAKHIQVGSFLEANWLPNALILGVIFIILFNVMALTTERLGASVGSIANKMALVVPVVFAIIYYGDSVSALKIMGVILALLGIVLSSLKPKTFKKDFHKSDLWLPFILLIGSGFIDTFVKYTEEYSINSRSDAQLFSATIFFTAFIIGILSAIFRSEKHFFQLRNLIGGAVLGLVNFGSIYFLLETFRSAGLQSSVVFPINNVGVVLLTSGFSFWLFKERYSRMNQLGIFCAVMAVILISLS
jgi:drug/metabolite transporter (DMT)-like permease